MRVEDEADENDVEIYGWVKLDNEDLHDIEGLENKAAELLKKHFQKLLHEFPGLKISLDETNFKEGWIYYTVRSDGDDTTAVNVWKKNQGVGLIPTPESKVGADIY